MSMIATPRRIAPSPASSVGLASTVARKGMLFFNDLVPHYLQAIAILRPSAPIREFLKAPAAFARRKATRLRSAQRDLLMFAATVELKVSKSIVGSVGD